MKVYLYDPETKEYKSEYSPQKNPKNPAEYLYPQNSTIKKPLLKEGQVPVFNGTNWEYIPDYREKEIINLDTKQISKMKEIGEIKEGYLLLEDYHNTDEYILEQKQLELQAQEEEIKREIYELDMKRIRAMVEPETREDGESWLEYYTNQIIVLREKLKELN